MGDADGGWDSRLEESHNNNKVMSNQKAVLRNEYNSLMKQQEDPVPHDERILYK